MIYANRPMIFKLPDGSQSENVNVCFENGNRTLSLALDNSAGRMDNLGRSDIRLLVDGEDITSKVFETERDDTIVRANLNNFEKAMRWLSRVEWGMVSSSV